MMATSLNLDHHRTATGVASALAVSSEYVATALLGEPSQRSRHELRWGARGSLALSLSGSKRGLYFDHERGEGGDLLTLIARQRSVSLGEAIVIAQREFLGEIRRAPVPPRLLSAKVRDDGAEARVAAADRLWGETVPLSGTLAETYFTRHRKLELGELELTHALRWHARTGAVVARMTDAVTGAPLGVHRTFIGPDGSKLERKMLGSQGVVCLSRNEDVLGGLGIAEGIEDSLAILISGWRPVWAAGSAGAIARFPVLPGIEALTIFADSDVAGMNSAEACRDRWAASGRDVAIASPRRLK